MIMGSVVWINSHWGFGTVIGFEPNQWDYELGTGPAYILRTVCGNNVIVRV